MRPAVLAGLGVALLAGAALVGRTARGSGPPPAALGAARALAANALFLRAEALRETGRADETPPLYRRVLELDPDNVAAIDFLADVEARDLRTEAPTAEGRVRWWKEAMSLVETALEKRPDAARLAWRAADLLIVLPAADPAVAAHLEASGRDADIEGLRLLLRSVRLAGDIPPQSRLHLEVFAAAAPRIAAKRFVKSAEGFEEALAACREGLAIREADFAAFSFGTLGIPASERLRAATNLVDGVARRLRASPPDTAGARALHVTYRETIGDDGVARALAPLFP